jgi:hypothetical protein
MTKLAAFRDITKAPKMKKCKLDFIHVFHGRFAECLLTFTSRTHILTPVSYLQIKILQRHTAIFCPVIMRRRWGSWVKEQRVEILDFRGRT